MKKILIVIGLLVFLLGFVAYGFWSGADARRTVALISWTRLQTQFQAKADLVPNLVKKFGEYARERDNGTLEAVTRACDNVTSQTKLDPNTMSQEQLNQYGAAQEEFARALSKMLELDQGYFAMKLDEEYLELHGRWAETDHIISAEIKHFNQNAQEYDNYISWFPGGFFKVIPCFETQQFSIH